MGKISKEMLRRDAKKIYKEQTKKIPRKNRIPFAQFFRQYIKMKNTNEKAAEEIAAPQGEDFNFDELINISKISDSELVSEEQSEPSEPTDVEEK